MVFLSCTKLNVAYFPTTSRHLIPNENSIRMDESLSTTPSTPNMSHGKTITATDADTVADADANADADSKSDETTTFNDHSSVGRLLNWNSARRDASSLSMSTIQKVSHSLGSLPGKLLDQFSNSSADDNNTDLHDISSHCSLYSPLLTTEESNAPGTLLLFI